MWARAFHTEPLVVKSAGTFIYTMQDWSSNIEEYQYPEGEGPEIDTSKIGGSDKDKTEGDKHLEEIEEAVEDVAKGIGMVVIIIIIVAVACVLIIVVGIIFCVVRSNRNKKTRIVMLNEGGEAEMKEIDHKTFE